MIKRRILIIEDDPSLAEGLFELLEHHGYECERALTVEDARTRLGVFRPHILVADYMLTDGPISVLLEELGREPAFPVVIMSRHAAARNLKGTPAVHAVLAKPFTYLSLLHNIESALAAA